MASHYPAIARTGSPAPDALPTPALGASPGMSRCLSTSSTISRESLGSDASSFSRHSSASYRNSDIPAGGDRLRPRDSTGSVDTVNGSRSSSKRRGYMRPQGTDFAASARARESVLSLGSIAHLQYYFARTGLLDGKGGRLARKRDNKARTLDLSALDTSAFLTPKPGSDHDSSYASMGSSPDLTAHSGFGSATFGTGSMVESPLEEHHPDEDYYSDFDDDIAHMLPPTTSTYNYREKPVPKPPTVAELRSDLTSSLDTAEQTLHEAKTAKMPPELRVNIESADVPQESIQTSSRRPSLATPGWYEIQGLNILDVMTLAIRAAKIYYTAHDRPDRLDAIKSEKQLRGELLSVMDILKRMATRGFAGGMRDDEFDTMRAWIASLRNMLTAEDAMEAEEVAERTSWTWLHPEGWEGREFEREEAFIRSMLKGPDPIENMPRLVQLHNCAVRKSRRRFGAIPTFYADTQKPYRAADNLRYFLKAAELRWEVLLRADPLGLQYNTAPELWVDFENAVLQWCRKVREEITAELEELEREKVAAEVV
ncbi:hypothetical protein N0V88_004686 [Collariella sp. IMI 366227]|nr:hypothetical protein N0V88_004686 [Collariella sp. IMI 366227]